MINSSDDQNIPGLMTCLTPLGENLEVKNQVALAFMYQMREKKIWSLNKLMKESLTLLGLEDAIDIDYATYKTLLREKMMEGRMAIVRCQPKRLKY